MRPLRLPVCPHCGARYFYGQVSRTKGNREGQCPHCGGKYLIVYQKQRILLFLAAAAVAVAFNILLLWGFEVQSLIPLYVSTLLFVIAAFLLVPFAVRYQKRPPKQRQPAVGKPDFPGGKRDGAKKAAASHALTGKQPLTKGGDGAQRAGKA